MTIKAIVVDDEPLARARLKRLLIGEGAQVIAESVNGQDAVDLVRSQLIDMVFIDINMPVKNGLQAAQEISLLENPPAIIFCTAYDQHAVAAFKTNAVAYLLKPIQAQDIKAAINKASALSRFQLNQLLNKRTLINSLAVHYQGVLQNIPSNEFMYFRSVNKNVYATLDNGDEILVDRTLKKLEAELGDEFVRVHRAALMNKQQASKLIKDADGKVSVVLKSVDVSLSVSRRHLSEVKRCFK